MADQLQLRRDTPTNVALYTPAKGEIIIDTTAWRPRVGNGSTAGGIPLALESDIPGAAPLTANHAGSPYAPAAGVNAAYHADPTAGTIQFNLPASPTLWQKAWVKDTTGQSGTNAITVSGNGNNIEGASTIVINIAYGMVSLQWNGTQWVQIP